MNKEEILNAIRETAKQNGGVPLGEGRFKKTTGVSSWELNKYWARFGDAQKEAGFKPNQLQVPHDRKFLIEKVIALFRKLGKFPTTRELTLERNIDPEFPSKGTFQRLGTKRQLAIKVLEYCESADGYGDVAKLCQSILVSDQDGDLDSEEAQKEVGEVYLFKSGRYYKIGKTNDSVRRGTELRIQLPEKCILIHSIKTDDTSGIENYWHRRFEAKRMNGEWFDLSSSDVKAFKCWKRII